MVEHKHRTDPELYHATLGQMMVVKVMVVVVMAVVGIPVVTSSDVMDELTKNITCSLYFTDVCKMSLRLTFATCTEPHVHKGDFYYLVGVANIRCSRVPRVNISIRLAGQIQFLVVCSVDLETCAPNIAVGCHCVSRRGHFALFMVKRSANMRENFGVIRAEWTLNSGVMDTSRLVIIPETLMSISAIHRLHNSNQSGNMLLVGVIGFIIFLLVTLVPFTFYVVRRQKLYIMKAAEKREAAMTFNYFS